MRFILVIVWVAVVLVAYEMEFPFDLGGAAGAMGEALRAAAGGFPRAFLEIPLAWAAMAWGLAVFGVAQAGCWAAGSVLAAWLAPGLVLTGRLRWLVTVLLGWLGVGSGLLGLGLAGLFHPVVLGTLAAVLLACFLLPRPLHSVRNWLLTREYWTALFPPGRDLLARAAALLSLAALAATAVSLLAPQTALPDLSRHLAAADRALKLHRCAGLPGNFFFDLPLLTEMLRGWSLGLGGEPAARLWPLAALALGGAAAFTVIEPLAGVRWGWIGGAAWTTAPFTIGLALAGEPALFLAPLALGAAALLIRPRLRRRTAFLAGILGGGILAADLPSAAWPLLVVAALVVLNWNRRISPVAGLFFLAAGTILTAGAWLARAWLLHCDPFYPFGRSGCGMTAAAVGAFMDHLHGAGLKGSYDTLFARYVSPWSVTMTEGLSPFWLAFVPFALLSLRLGLSVKLLGGAAALGVAGWMIGPPQPALGVPALAWLTAAIAVGVAAHHAAERRIITGLVGATLLFQALHAGVFLAGTGSAPAGLGLEGRRAYFARKLRSYSGVLERLKREIPPGARVLMVGDTRLYPSPGDLVAASPYEPFAPFPLIRASRSVSDLKRRLRQLGVRYVVHNHAAALERRGLAGVQDWAPGDVSVWAEFWRLHSRLLVLPGEIDMDDGGHYVYRIAGARREPLVTPTLPGIEPAFSAVEAGRKRGRLQDASRKVEVLQGLAGDFPSVKYLVGTAWYADDVYRSYELLKAADAGGLRHLDLWSELARLAEARWRVEEALLYEDRIARFEPRVPIHNRLRLLVRLATGAMTRRRYDDAEKYLRQALRLDPENAALWARLSEVLDRLKRRIGAEGAIRKAVEIDPENEEYLRFLRRLLR